MDNFRYGAKRRTTEEQRDHFLKEHDSGGVDVCNMLLAYENLSDDTILEFLSLAFRHVDIKGDVEFDDIRLGLKMAISNRFGY
jgi:hypothetical protein